MTRAFLSIGLLLSIAACASSQPPLLEEDGQYQPPREERVRQAELERIREGFTDEQVKEERTRRRWFGRRDRAAEEVEETTVAELPPALTQPVPRPYVETERAVGAIETPVASAPLSPADFEPEAPARIVGEVAPDLDRPRYSPPEAVPATVTRTPVPELPTVSETNTLASQRFPELSPLTPVKPSDERAPAPSATGPYFVAETPAELPPVAASPSVQPPAVQPTARPQETLTPRIVGEAAPEALSGSVSPTVRRPAPVVAEGSPQPLSRPLSSPVVSAPSAAAPAPVATATSTNDPVAELQRAAAQKVVAKVNEYRARNRLGPLEYSPELSLIAQGHVAELAERGQVSALNREGHTIGVRLLNSGYNPQVAGSLVAGGYPNFDRAFESWTRNQVEASRLLLPAATHMGFAVITDPGSTYRTYIEAIVAGQ